MTPGIAGTGVVSHYRLLELIGHGGMGYVYKARDTRLDRLVALKFLVPRLLVSSSARIRFEKEARAISSLSHPNIAVLYDIDSADDQPFLVLEYLGGGTLASRMRGRRLRWEEIVRYGTELAAGLHHAHRHGIVHRDVKPGNALFSDEGQLKLVDFGLAKWRLSTNLSAEVPGCGTVEYIAPEQLLGRGTDERSDIFSLGVVLYEMAAGQLPFRGEDREAIVDKLLHASPEPLETIRPDLAKDFCRVVSRCLEKDPVDRVNSTPEIFREAAGQPLSDAVTETCVPEPTPADETKSVPRLGGRLWWIAGIAVALVVGLLSLTDIFRRPAQPAAARTLLTVLPFEFASRETVQKAFWDELSVALATRLASTMRLQRSLWMPHMEDSGYTETGEKALKFVESGLALSIHIERDAPPYSFSLRIFDAGAKRDLGSRSFEASGGQASDLEHDLAKVSLELVGSVLTDAQQTGVFRDRSRSPRAADLSLRADELMESQNRNTIDQAISVLNEAQKLDPQSVSACSLRAEALLRQFWLHGDRHWLDEAEKEARKADSMERGLPVNYLTLGNIRLERGLAGEAIKDFERATQIAPENEEAWRSLATAKEGANDLEGTLAAYRRAIEIAPNHWRPHDSFGSFLYSHGFFELAENEFQTVVRMIPKRGIGYDGRAAVLWAMGRSDEAIKECEKSVAIEPSAGGYCNLATMKLYMGQPEEAVRLFQKASTLKPLEPDAWMGIGDAYSLIPSERYLANDEYRIAISLLERRLEMNPNASDNWAMLALCQARLGLLKEARKSLSAVDRVRSLSTPCLIYRVRAEELLGNRERALEVLSRLLKSGYHARQLYAEPDLDKLRDDPRVKSILPPVSTDSSH
jgi:eukaryotic-like serine/threonine-protein kinase